MSDFIGAALPQFILAKKDIRLNPTWFERARRTGSRGRRLAMMASHWPRSGFTGDMAADVGLMQAQWYVEPVWRFPGEASRVGFFGITRDQYGAPLAGVTCSLFLTATRAWIMDIVSDSTGYFLLQSWYSPDTHFIVFHKAGAPAVFGSTDQNLVGA